MSVCEGKWAFSHDGDKEAEADGLVREAKNECDHCGRCGEHQVLWVEVEGWVVG